MSSFTNRFHAVQDRVSKLFGLLEMHGWVTAGDQSDSNEDVRVAGFVAAQHVRYAQERMQSAIQSLRKQEVMLPLVITPDDYERFLERCFGIAGALGISSDHVASGLISEAELALKHADEAIKSAEDCYTGTGKTLAE